MRRIIIGLLALVCVLLLVPIRVHAQDAVDPITIRSLDVQIWPEYDQPGVLVIYQIILDTQTRLPARMTIPIPTSAGGPANVAFRDPADGNLYNLQFSKVVSGDSTLVTFDTTAYEMQLEYYDPNLSVNGSTKEYNYRWNGAYDIESMRIRVQQPIGASAMRLEPSMGTPVQDPSGLSVFTKDVGAVPRGSNLEIKIGYDKTDSRLTVEQLNLIPSAPITDQTAGRQSMDQWWIILLVVLGILALGAFFWWLWLMEHSPHPAEKGRRHRPKLTFKSPSDDEHTYCHQCGQRAQLDDVYCRTCGTKLRKI